MLPGRVSVLLEDKSETGEWKPCSEDGVHEADARRAEGFTDVTGTKA